MIPDFFIVGATKCATYTLYEYLNSHEAVVMSKDKEPYIVASDTHLGNMHKLYEEQYDDKLCKLKGDCGANNLVIKYVPERIKKLNHSAQIIILTRDPTSRAFSHWQYMYNLRPGIEYDFRKALIANAKTFDLDKFELESDYVHTAIKEWGNSKRMYLETGFFDHYIKGYSDILDTLVLSDKDLRHQRGFDEICDFLEIERITKKTRDRNVQGNNVYDYDEEAGLALDNFYATGDISHILKLESEL